jgi:hypothetical protein
MKDLKTPLSQTSRPSSSLDSSKLIKTGPWTAEEDRVVIDLVQENGPQKWTFIASHLSGRIGKQCRERWHNHLNPQIRKDDWHIDEEWLLFLLHKSMGNSWAEIAKVIRGRTDNSIKNHWNSTMKKQLPEFGRSYERYLNLYGHYETGHTCQVTEGELADCVRRKRGRNTWDQTMSSLRCSAVFGQVLGEALGCYKAFTDCKKDREDREDSEDREDKEGKEGKEGKECKESKECRPQVYAGQVQETNFLHVSFASAFRGFTPTAKRTRYVDNCYNCKSKPFLMALTPEQLRSPLSIGSLVFESPSRMLDLESSPVAILRF